MTTINRFIVCASLVGAAAYLALPLQATAISPNMHVPGNNGSLKVHEKDTPAATESNDPKVCTFNFEGYGFDKGQSGVVIITKQGGGTDRSEVKRIDLPAANESGYMETGYVTIGDGHYKTTAYGKDVHGDIDYKIELKMKSKVIKVVCETTPEVPTGTGGGTNGNGTTNGGGQGQTSSTSTTSGTVAGASTTTLPQTIASTGAQPLQAVVNALCAGAGIYSAMLARKQR